MQVDSGAVDTVGPKSVGRAFNIKETHAPHNGNNYVAANGSAITNYGERLIKGETENGLTVSMPIQLADVKKVLMSTHKMNETGLKVILDGENSYIVDKWTGRTTPIKYEHGRYFFDIWAPAPIKNNIKKQTSSDDMDTSNNKIKGNMEANTNSTQFSNRCWVLGTENEDEGF